MFFLHSPGCYKQICKYCRACNFFAIWLWLLISNLQLVLEFIIQYVLKILKGRFLGTSCIYLFRNIWFSIKLTKCNIIISIISNTSHISVNRKILKYYSNCMFIIFYSKNHLKLIFGFKEYFLLKKPCHD